jgi:hypothetical protein
MDKWPTERCPFSRPFNNGRKAANKGKRAVFSLKYSLSSFVERPTERTPFSGPFVH